MDEEYKSLLAERNRLISELNATENRIEIYLNRVEILNEFGARLREVQELAADDEFIAQEVLNTLTDKLLNLKDKETRKKALYLSCDSLRQVPALFEKFTHRLPEEEVLPVLLELESVPMTAWGNIVFFNPALFEHFQEQQKYDLEFLSALVQFNPLVFRYFTEAAKAQRSVQLSFLKACRGFDIYVNESEELFDSLKPALSDRSFLREAVARYPLITYLAPKEFLEDPEFAYDLFSVDSDSVKPLYLSLIDCSDELDTENVKADLLARIEAARFQLSTPQGKPSSKKNIKI